jgi:hypothetical protein
MNVKEKKFEQNMNKKSSESFFLVAFLTKYLNEIQTK